MTAIIRLMAWAFSVSFPISPLSARGVSCTVRMPATTSCTACAPCSALSRVAEDTSEAAPAFLATSSTVEFISSMAVAVSVTRAACSAAPCSDSSICEESSVDAEETMPATSSRRTAAFSMPSRLACASLLASSACRRASCARLDSSCARSDSLCAFSIFFFRLSTMVRISAYTPTAFGSLSISSLPPATSAASSPSSPGSLPSWRKVLRTMTTLIPTATTTAMAISANTAKREVS